MGEAGVTVDIMVGECEFKLQGYVEGGMDLISKAIGNAAIESGAHVTNVEDPGAQVPTNVTGMLKFGTNLLQAVGQFNERVRAEVVECGCVIELPELKQTRSRLGGLGVDSCKLASLVRVAHPIGELEELLRALELEDNLFCRKPQHVTADNV
ncbi:hypothetical protein JHK82_039720 [Glycine max]|nr:hypothetical protein JHK86_039914 [Glycine max]KAG4965520.1 hypothetical protein JHK85_040495 [Glycine max]KAG5110497.1 hypothetical protein JHK82_039720 [Glycine max]